MDISVFVTDQHKKLDAKYCAFIADMNCTRHNQSVIKTSRRKRHVL